MNIKGFGKAEQEAIAKFEQYIGFSLPEDYIQFLREYNGGSARGNTCFVAALNEEIPLNVFYGLNVDEKELDLRSSEEENTYKIADSFQAFIENTKKFVL